MGSKQDPHRSYGQKIITLLAQQLCCSKQSVLRLLVDLQRAHRRVWEA